MSILDTQYDHDYAELLELPTYRSDTKCPKHGENVVRFRITHKCALCYLATSKGRKAVQRQMSSQSDDGRDLAHDVAVKTGAKTYISNRPCRHHGVNPERHTKHKYCVACNRERAAGYYQPRNNGFVRVTYAVHREDLPLVGEFIRQLSELRGLK